MQEHYNHNGIRFVAGHVLDVWPALAAQGVRVQTVITSIPYYGLRAYGTEPQVWSGDPACDHAWQEQRRKLTDSGSNGAAGSTLEGSKAHQTGQRAEVLEATCTRCAAWRGELGQEPTPDLFVAHIVAVFRAVRQALRPDGTLWLNIGDSYTRTGGEPGGGNRELMHLEGKQRRMTKGVPGFSDKQLLLMPARVALALQADGWVLRNECIWHKTAPMPESVQDRFTRAHEQVFVFSQRPRYFMDMAAIREPNTEGTVARVASGPVRAIGENGKAAAARGDHGPAYTEAAGRNPRDVWTLGPDPYADAHFACVDDQTEALTQQGWKRHDELVSGELIAAYSLHDQRLRWRPLQAVARYQVENEPLVYADAASLNMALTPNHRCVIQRRRLGGGYSDPVITRADALRHSDYIPTAAEWADEGEAFDPTWAELLGWYVAEGHACRNSLAVEIYQSLDANAPKVERLRELLGLVCAEYSEATGHRTWRGRETAQTVFRVTGFAAARLRELAPYKRLSADVLRWSTPALRALMSGLIEGDGHTRVDDARMSFIQREKATADLVQAIAVRLGWSAALSPKTGASTWTVYFTQHTRRSLRGTRGTGALVEQRPYTGIVWCPRTVDTTWVARREGRVFITGNTFPREIPRRAILAGTSAAGCCAQCGSPYRRVVERTAMQIRRSDWGAQAGNRTASSGTMISPPRAETVGWQPGCRCNAGEPQPCLVADPFLGSGTSAAVAYQLGRGFVGGDLNAQYLDLAVQRMQGCTPWYARADTPEATHDLGPLFAGVA